jgi:hypothetical protein
MARWLILTLFIFIALSSDAIAQFKAYYGAGKVSCAEWVQFRTTGDKPNSYQVEAWIDGYLSGYNVYDSGADFLLSQPKSIALYAWIDNYCGSKPLDQIVQAASALRTELQSRTPR